MRWRFSDFRFLSWFFIVAFFFSVQNANNSCEELLEIYHYAQRPSSWETQRNITFPGTQSFTGSLSAVGRREKLWDSGISLNIL